MEEGKEINPRGGNNLRVTGVCSTPCMKLLVL